MRAKNSIVIFRLHCRGYVPKHSNNGVKYQRCRNYIDVGLFSVDIVNIQDEHKNEAHYKKTRCKAIEKNFNQGKILCEQCLNSRKLNPELNNLRGGNGNKKKNEEKMDVDNKRLPISIPHNDNAGCLQRG